MDSTKTMRTSSLFILIACAALADGIGFNGDRVTDQKTTVLVLTSNQQAAVVSAKLTADNLCNITLTSAQQAQLVAEAGFAPTNLCVRSLAAVKDHCTCEELNLGILFKSDKVEIPHFLLGTDLNDRGKSRLRRLKENKGASTNGVPRLSRDWDVPPKRDNFHIFMLMGQSNMAGCGKLENGDTTPEPGVLAIPTKCEGGFAWKPAAHPLHNRLSSDRFGLGLPFVAGQLGEFYGEGRGHNAPERLAQIQVVQAALRDLPKRMPQTAWAPSKDFKSIGDKVHFDRASLIEFGKRYAAALETIKKP
jgi:hypothetical protein